MFQDFLSNFPLVFAVPDQKSVRIAKLLVEEVVPLFGVPEALLSDRVTNLLSYLINEGDMCLFAGQKAQYDLLPPQCDGMVERFNQNPQEYAAQTCSEV